MERFINRCINNGAQPISPRDLANRIVPQVPHLPWEEGCHIIIPQNAVLLSETFFVDDNRMNCEYIVVEVVFPDGIRQMDKLFLSTLTRTIVPNGLKRPVSTFGTAVDFVRQFTTWDKAILALCGKTLLVTKNFTYGVTDRQRDAVRETHIFGLDLL